MNKISIYQIVLLIVAIAILPACNRYIHNENAYDDDFIPYGIRSFEVYVYNENTDKEYYAGSIHTNYENAQKDLSDAQSLAYDFAESRHLKNWDYLCYTATKSSDCVTKVK